MLEPSDASSSQRINEGTPTSPCRMELGIVFVIACGLRCGWAVYRMLTADSPNSLEFPDETQYWLIATNLWNNGTLLDEFGFRATRLPLYPAILAPWTALTNGVCIVKLMQCALASVTPILIMRETGNAYGKKAAWIAGIAVACDPFLIFFSSLMLTETWFILLFTFVWTTAHRLARQSAEPGIKAWMILGAAIACSSYMRETGIVLSGLVVLALIGARGFSRASLAGSAAVALMGILAFVPWAARNQSVTGEWIWLTTRGGISLYDGVRPDADGSSRLEGVQQNESTAEMTESEWHHHFRSLAWEHVRNEPGRVAALAAVKLARTWNPIPNVDTYQSPLIRFVSAAWMIPLYTLVLFGSVFLLTRTKTVKPLTTIALAWMPVIGICLLHVLFVGSVRYRLPAIPMLEMVAGMTISRALSPNNQSDRWKKDG